METAAKVAEEVKTTSSAKRTWGLLLWIAIVLSLACVLVLFAYTVKSHWNDFNFVNFLTAWIPFVLSVLLAFIPDAALKTHSRIVWRTGVILGGLLYSLLLWHQQSLALTKGMEAQRQLVSSAITSANAHTDQQIGSVRNDVRSVKTDVQGIKGDIQETQSAMSQVFSESAASITNSISKVGKPDPPEKAKVSFSLWPFYGDSADLANSLTPDKDGVFTVDVTFRDVANTAAASNMDVWLDICSKCRYVSEPAGFDKPAGIDEHVRHLLIPLLNPGITFQKTSIRLRLEDDVRNAPYFDIGFTYACQGCAKDAHQIARIYVANAQ